jgi:hypothetical protein
MSDYVDEDVNDTLLSICHNIRERCKDAWIKKKCVNDTLKTSMTSDENQYGKPDLKYFYRAYVSEYEKYKDLSWDMENSKGQRSALLTQLKSAADNLKAASDGDSTRVGGKKKSNKKRRTAKKSRKARKSRRIKK